MAFGIKATLDKEDNGLEPLETKTEVTPQPEQPIDVGEKKPNVEAKNPEAPVEPKPLELNDDLVSDYLKNKYYQDKEFVGLDNLIKGTEPQIKEVEKVVEKVVNPYEDVIDEYEKKYFEFKRETGNGRKEYEFVQKDLSKMSLLDLAQQKISKDTGLSLSASETKEYLYNKLNVDFSEGELSMSDRVELNAFVKPYKDELYELQQKYLQPAPQPKQPLGNDDLRLPNGTVISREAYQQQLDQEKARYIEDIKQGASSAASSEFAIEFDDNGEKRQYNFAYNFSEQDKHSMLSDGSDIDAMLQKRFATENGFDHSKLVQGLWWMDPSNQKKVIAAAMKQARAEAIAEVSAIDNNDNFSNAPLEPRKPTKNGYGELPNGNENATRGFGVRRSIAS